MEWTGTAVTDVDGASWGSNPFVSAAPARYSAVRRGTYCRTLKLPVTADRTICLERHRMYSAAKYAGLASSKRLADALGAEWPAPLADGIVFTGAATHWHYVVDGLGNFRGLERLGPRTVYVDRDVSDDQIRFLLAFARAAGCDEVRAVVRLAGEFFRFSDCVFPCRGEIDSAVAWVRSVLGVERPHMAQGPQRLFVARNHAAVRHLVNQDEIGELLRQRFGFATVDPSVMSLESQRFAFRDARVIVGPHGAGLVNAMFAARPRLLVELYHSTQQQFYGALAHALGADYLPVRGESTGEAGGEFARRPDNADFRIDCDALTAALAGVPALGRREVERVKGIEPSS
jgi:Glycosyltransferase 61